ncbi:MAG TPA: protein-glutamate O-methyltransferase CheR [Gemmatimonas sp.]|uniref:CheR family methyltransferase n=1 Tax=Gemmatimonas sp. TaxID=1962908 RepID=UPI002EDA22CF
MSTSASGKGHATSVAMQLIAQLVRERTGLVFSDARWSLLERGVGDTMAAARLPSVARLLQRLETDATLLNALVARITVGETYFQRDAAQLDLIRDTLVPQLRAIRPAGHRLHLWSAGCATGEEAYTLAMLTSEMGILPTPSILGTDISRPALARAVRARYSQWSLRGLSAEVVEQYFARDGVEWVLHPDIASAVTFAPLNLVADEYPPLAGGTWGMDIILCRNVLIYFDRDEAQQVIARLLDALSDDGYLVLGVADPLPPPSTACEPEVTSAGVVLRRRPRNGASSSESTASALWRNCERVVAPLTFTPTPSPSEGSRDAAHEWHLPQSASQANAQPWVPRSIDDVTRSSDPLSPDATSASDVDAMEAAYLAADYATAHLAAQRIVKQGHDARAAVVLVRTLANRGLLDDAARWCDVMIGDHRECTELYCLQAMFLLDAKHPQEAATAARAALYLDRTLIVGHLLVGRALLGMGDHARARHAFRRAARLLDAHPADEPVRAADGERPETLQRVVREHLSLLHEAA